ncbi:MAG TPA: cyanophycinase [Balneolaceae bacterium]
MGNRVTIIILLAMFIGACSMKPAESTNEINGKLFIIGGGHKPTSMVQKMIKESGIREGGYGIVLPMSSSVPDTSAYYGMLQFQELGIENMHAFNFADSNLKSVDAKLDSLRNATLVYIPGGVQGRFMKAVYNTPGLEKAIKEAYAKGALIAGTSAGAAIMSEIMITGDQKNYPEYTSTFYHLEKGNIITAEGLGLITGVIIDQHFIARARNNRLLTAIMEFPGHIGIGIDESTAIVVQGAKVKVVGKSQVIVYRNLSGSAHVQNGKIASQNIRLDIYLPGETFSI